MSDSRTRSVLKTFSWRILATLTTMAVAYLVTGEATAAIAIGSVEFVLKLLLYYWHERLWLWIPDRKLL